MVYLIVISFCIGVLYANSTFLYMSGGVLCGVVLYGVFCVAKKRDVYVVGVLCLVVLSFCLGSFRVLMFDREYEFFIEEWNGEYVNLSGVVVSVEEREYRTRVIVALDDVRKFKVLVWKELYVNVSIGDVVSFSGIVEVPESFETDTGRVFDYTAYLAKDTVYLEMSEPVSFERTEVRFTIGRLLSIPREWFLGNIQSVLPEPAGALAGGILLGEVQSLGEDIEEEFRVSGLSHIVVLSGYNITIIAEVIFFLLSFLPLMVASIAGGVGIILFALLVGGGATVVRATIMGLFALVARITRRSYMVTRVLFLAGFLMVLYNPRILADDISFQLSFIATLGLILGTPVLERVFSFVPEKFGLKEVVTTTLAAQIFVLPWILYTIGNLSFVAFPANLLVLPTVPLAMLCSFVVGILPLSIIGLPAYVLLGYELFVVHLFAHIPFASVVLPQIPFVGVLLCYCLLFYIVWKYGSFEEGR